MQDVGFTTVSDAWHLDKKVPIALILAIVAQGAAVIWYAARIDGRIDSVEKRALALEVAQESDRMWQGGVRADLGEIKGKLGILVDRMQAEGRRP